MGSSLGDAKVSGVADHEAALAHGIREEARLRALGISASLNASFPCVLHGHHEQASTRRSERGFVEYWCGHEDRWFGLGEIRAFLGYHHTRNLSHVEAARWQERLSYDAGLLKPSGVTELPPGLSSAARRAGEGCQLLVGLRDERWGDDPFVFARKFAMAYCTLTDEQARRGVVELEQAQIIQRVGKCHLAIEWRPGPGWLSD